MGRTRLARGRIPYVYLVRIHPFPYYADKPSSSLLGLSFVREAGEKEPARYKCIYHGRNHWARRRRGRAQHKRLLRHGAAWDLADGTLPGRRRGTAQRLIAEVSAQVVLAGWLGRACRLLGRHGEHCNISSTIQACVVTGRPSVARAVRPVLPMNRGPSQSSDGQRGRRETRCRPHRGLPPSGLRAFASPTRCPSPGVAASPRWGAAARAAPPSSSTSLRCEDWFL
jgi:hypothetical protein